MLNSPAARTGKLAARLRAACVALMLGAGFASAAPPAEKGWLGVAWSVEAEQSADPIVRSVVVVDVVPGSPAALAGLRPGDMLVAVQDLKVSGSKASVFKRSTQKAVGETLQLKVKHGKVVRDVAIVAIAKPVHP